MRKVRWIPPLKYLKKIKTVSRVMQKSNATGSFIIFQTLFSKGVYEAHTELIKAKIQLKIKESAHHFSKISCDLSPLSERPSLKSMWNY